MAALRLARATIDPAGTREMAASQHGGERA